MKIIVACDSFKGCMSSKEVEESIKKGILKANNKHEVLTFPMADGPVFRGLHHECLEAILRKS